MYQNKTQKIEILDDEKEMIQNEFQISKMILIIWNLSISKKIGMIRNDVKWYKMM